jgi:hypothetical protein
MPSRRRSTYPSSILDDLQAAVSGPAGAEAFKMLSKTSTSSSTMPGRPFMTEEDEISDRTG